MLQAWWGDGDPEEKGSPGNRGKRRWGQFPTIPFSCFLSPLYCLYFKEGWLWQFLVSFWGERPLSGSKGRIPEGLWHFRALTGLSILSHLWTWVATWRDFGYVHFPFALFAGWKVQKYLNSNQRARDIFCSISCIIKPWLQCRWWSCRNKWLLTRLIRVQLYVLIYLFTDTALNFGWEFRPLLDVLTHAFVQAFPSLHFHGQC